MGQTMIISSKGPQTVSQIEVQFENRNLFLSPLEYQRENAWDLAQKQLLIDSLFRGLDIPKFYLWRITQRTLSNGYPDGDAKVLYRRELERKRVDNDDPDPYIFEMVDGQQRTRTILEFMGVRPPSSDHYRGSWHDPFPTLPDTPKARGKTYQQLNADQKIGFGESTLTIMVLEDATIDEIRDMFLRLQNGTPLNAQQKRDAMGSSIGVAARELANLPFFTNSVWFGNENAEHRLLASQIIHLELRDKILSCTSRQLDKLYKDYRGNTLDPNITREAKRVLTVLAKIFPSKNPRLTRTYALGLYWVFSRILQTYRIDTGQFSKILDNFENLDHRRLEALERDYSQANDKIYEDLSWSMSRGTDGAEAISTRYEILTQLLFDDVEMTPRPDLDPNRNFSNEEKLILFHRVKGCCQLQKDGRICGRAIDFTDAAVDHILPHSRGGKTTLDNGRIAYSRCNISRGNRDTFNPQTDCLMEVAQHETPEPA